ncbi:MAG: hypothetical protein WCK31_04205 [bacterium]
MKLNELKQKLGELKVFSVDDIKLIDPNFRQETLYEWKKMSWVIKLRSNNYIFSDYKPTNYDLYLIANKIYSPSYISLELALNHYGVIPEAVQTITSVTTNSTLEVDTEIGKFSYKSISEGLFWGYELIKIDNTTYRIATLEKAIIDFFHFNNNVNSFADLEGLRFNIEILKESLKTSELNRMVKTINSATLTQRVNLLLKYIK